MTLGIWGSRTYKDYQRLMAVIQQGLAAPEHAAFVSRLAATRTS